MYRKRIFPLMLISHGKSVKTQKFKNPRYVGDPINIASIFSEFQVDELMIHNIDATKEKSEIDFDLLRRISHVSKMPLGYGGGITHLDQAKRIFDLGYEKISFNNALFYNLGLVEKISNIFGAQAVCASLDFIMKDNLLELYRYALNMTYHSDFSLRFISRIVNFGIGEITMNSVNTEGTLDSFPSYMFKNLLKNISVSVIAHGGISNLQQAQDILNDGFNGVSSGSAYIFQNISRGVVIHKMKKN